MIFLLRSSIEKCYRRRQGLAPLHSFVDMILFIAVGKCVTDKLPLIFEQNDLYLPIMKRTIIGALLYACLPHVNGMGNTYELGRRRTSTSAALYALQM